VSHESIRLWYLMHSLRSWDRPCNKFGPKYARSLKRRHRGFRDTFYKDEVFVKIGGNPRSLWRIAACNLFNLERQLVGAEHY